MSDKPGTLYGIGVGPGDPELITLKAVRVLNRADVVFAAASTKNSHSMAVEIARPHIPETTEVHMLQFPMTRDKSALTRTWSRHARTLIDVCESGKTAVFLTLGDSLTYSTFGYILRHVKQMAPRLPVVSVPGITSYHAAAAAANTPLVEGEESLLLVSGAKGGDCFRNLSCGPDTVAFLKAYRNVADICRSLDEAGMAKTSFAVSNCSLPEQEIHENVKVLCDKPPAYWTLVLAKKPKHDAS